MIICPRCGELKNIEEMSHNKKNRGPGGWCEKCVKAGNEKQRNAACKICIDISKKELERMYVDEKMTPREIGEKYGIGSWNVRRLLKTYEIPTRNISEAHLKQGIKKISKEELKKMYIDEGMAPVKIGEKIGVTGTTITRWLREYEIPLRNNSEAQLNADNGGEKCHLYIDGRSKENSPYCEKWTHNLRERCRDFFYRICQNCGKTEVEQMEDQKNRGKPQKRLSVHHVFYNKNTCCDNSERLILPLCASCHDSIKGEDPHYEYTFAREIRKKYNGICFFTKYMKNIEERKAYRHAAMSTK